MTHQRSSRRPGPQPRPQLTLALYAATEAARRLANASLAKLDMHIRHYAILRLLATSSPLAQQSIAEGLGIDPATTVGLVDDLERGALLVRRRNVSDRRAYAIELTPAGRARLDEAQHLLDECEQRFASNLSQADRRQLSGLLARLIYPD